MADTEKRFVYEKDPVAFGWPSKFSAPGFVDECARVGEDVLQRVIYYVCPFSGLSLDDGREGVESHGSRRNTWRILWIRCSLYSACLFENCRVNWIGHLYCLFVWSLFPGHVNIVFVGPWSALTITTSLFRNSIMHRSSASLETRYSHCGIMLMKSPPAHVLWLNGGATNRTLRSRIPIEIGTHVYFVKAWRCREAPEPIILLSRHTYFLFGRRSSRIVWNITVVTIIRVLCLDNYYAWSVLVLLSCVGLHFRLSKSCIKRYTSPF